MASRKGTLGTPEKDSAEDRCGHCHKVVKESSHAVLCDFCSLWHHAKCQGISSGAYRLMSKKEFQDANRWYCKKCGNSLKSLKGENQRLKKDKQDLRKDNQDLRKDNQDLKKDKQDLKKDNQDLQKDNQDLKQTVSLLLEKVRNFEKEKVNVEAQTEASGGKTYEDRLTQTETVAEPAEAPENQSAKGKESSGCHSKAVAESAAAPENQSAEEKEVSGCHSKAATETAAEPAAAPGNQPAEETEVPGCHSKTDEPKNLKKKWMKRTKPPIRIFGDSMVKKTSQHVPLKLKNSGCTSISGARIGEVKRKVCEEAKGMKDGLLVVQGGGNALGYVGQEKTVNDMLDAVKSVEGKNMKVAVVNVMRRPREGPEYERLRKSTNRKLHEELMRLKVEWLKEKKGDISFLDLDGTLKYDGLYSADGVHLNDEGNARMGRRIREWVWAKSLEVTKEI